MNITLAHVAMWTRDLERLRSFYETYFGAVANDKYVNPKTGFSSYFLSFDGSCRLEIMSMAGVYEDTIEPDRFRQGLIHLALSTGSSDGVDRLTAKIKADGYTVASAPRTTGDGYYESVVLDPDGNLVEITD